MPTISRFLGISIAMFFDDHGYPHFHARHAEGQAKVRIDDLEVTEPGGADLAPDTLYERVRTGAWPDAGVMA